MPTIEGKAGKLWIDAYVKKAGELAGVAKAVRALVKKTVAGCEEYVSPWKTAAFDANGPLCVFVLGKDHLSLAFLSGVKRLIAEAAKLNKKDPPSWKMVGMNKRRTKESKK